MAEFEGRVAVGSEEAPAEERLPTPRRWLVVLGAAIVAMVTGALVVVTTPPPPVPELVLIEAHVSRGTFTASGEAVESGRVCESGIMIAQHPSPGLGSQLPDGLTLQSKLVCDDGSGSMTIRAEDEGRNPLFKNDEGFWRLVEERGKDAHLEGEGRFSAERDSLGDQVLTIRYIGEVTPSP